MQKHGYLSKWRWEPRKGLLSLPRKLFVRKLGVLIKKIYAVVTIVYLNLLFVVNWLLLKITIFDGAICHVLVFEADDMGPRRL